MRRADFSEGPCQNTLSLNMPSLAREDIRTPSNQCLELNVASRSTCLCFGTYGKSVTMATARLSFFDCARPMLHSTCDSVAPAIVSSSIVSLSLSCRILRRRNSTVMVDCHFLVTTDMRRADCRVLGIHFATESGRARGSLRIYQPTNQPTSIYIVDK